MVTAEIEIPLSSQKLVLYLNLRPCVWKIFDDKISVS